MDTRVSRLFFLLFLFTGCKSPTPLPTPQVKVFATLTTTNFRNVEYVDNFDGDTVTVNLPNSIPNIFSYEIPVRVRHIDTAEIKGSTKCEREMAVLAKDLVSSLLKRAKKIDLEDVGRDLYFRLLAEIWVYDNVKIIPLSAYLLEQGYAVPYEGGTKPKVDWCKKLLTLKKKK